MSQEKKKPSFADLLRHPMANLVVGFVLTGVIGTGVTQYFTSKHKEHQRIQQLAQERKEVVAKLSSLNAEHLASAEQLLFE